MAHQCISVIHAFFCNGMAELYSEIVGKVIRYPAIVITRHTGHAPILPVNRQRTSTVVGIHNDILGRVLRKGDFEYRSA